MAGAAILLALLTSTTGALAQESMHTGPVETQPGTLQPQNGLPAKAEVQQQQADTDRMRAETEAKRAAAAADRANAEAGAQGHARGGPDVAQHFHISGRITNDFALAAVPVYLLPNGVKLRVSGVFRPAEGVKCISYCENAPPSRRARFQNHRR